MLSEKQILILGKLPKIGKKTIFKIADQLSEAIQDDYDFKIKILTWALENNFSNLTNEVLDKANAEANLIIEKSDLSHIKMVGFWNPYFPDYLKKIKDPPVMLHVAGDIQILNKNRKVAIIGTREPSEFGMKAGKRLAEIFTSKNFIVVSGLAKGCDTVAHLGCLDQKGKTIAVMAHGLDMVYPKENTLMAMEIVRSGGALVSEYAVGQKPIGNFFVERDRLQAGLCPATIVIETDIKGGTMHTVKYTEDENKFLACLKHPEKYQSHPKVNGNTMLIATGRATGLETSDDIENFASKILERIGEFKQETIYAFSKTLFDINEFTIEDIPVPNQTKKKRVKKDPSKSKQEIIIWE